MHFDFLDLIYLAILPTNLIYGDPEGPRSMIVLPGWANRGVSGRINFTAQ